MIFVEILLFLISIILISFSISGYGRLVNFTTKDNFFLNIFLGLIIISFIVTTFHFFLTINIIVSSIILIFGLIIFFLQNKYIFLKLFEKKYFGLVIILFYIPMFLSQKYHEDFGYYHLPYALGFLEEKIVFGYANIDKSMFIILYG